MTAVRCGALICWKACAVKRRPSRTICCWRAAISGVNSSEPTPADPDLPHLVELVHDFEEAAPADLRDALA
jgi:hypothetical protein